MRRKTERKCFNHEDRLGFKFKKVGPNCLALAVVRLHSNKKKKAKPQKS